jgi:hypothetical protein
MLSRYSIKITKLDNAMQKGKKVKSLTISHEDGLYCENFEIKLYNYLRSIEKGLVDILTEIDKMELGEELHKQFIFKVDEVKSSNVFSPFYKPKKLSSIPEKWTRQHIIKAILSGQIKAGHVEQHLTDDYLSDATSNFDKGKLINVLDLCKDLVEAPSGWWINSNKDSSEEHVNIGVNCYHYKYNILKFEKNTIII